MVPQSIKALKHLGLSTTEIARAFGASNQAVDSWACDANAPRGRRLKAMGVIYSHTFKPIENLALIIRHSRGLDDLLDRLASRDASPPKYPDANPYAAAIRHLALTGGQAHTLLGIAQSLHTQYTAGRVLPPGSALERFCVECVKHNADEAIDVLWRSRGSLERTLAHWGLEK